MMNDKAADFLPRQHMWLRLLVALGAAGLALLALMAYPPAFESVRMMLARPIPSAMASDNTLSPSEARRQKVSTARAVVHGTYLKDPYGCVYMVEYVAAKLSLSPILDEQRRPVCH